MSLSNSILHNFYFVIFHLWLHNFPSKGGGQKKGSTRDPIFGGSCVPKPLPLEDSNITGVPEAARKIKRTKIRGR